MNKKYLLFSSNFVLILVSSCLNNTKGQVDSLRLDQLIKETNEQFLYSYVTGIYLSPFELIEHNRKQFVKNIEMVDSITFFRDFKTKSDTTLLVIKDNFTIISKPGDQYNSNTYVYLKDGRINKTYRGRHLDNYYGYDENGYLIQFGYGGELKKAKRTGKTFEWYRQKDDHLEFTTSYDENNQPLYFHKFRQKESSLALLSTLYLYFWDGQKLKSQTEIRNWQGGGNDSTFIKIEYGYSGTINNIYRREGKQKYWLSTEWSSTKYSTLIDTLDNNKIRITLVQNNIPVNEITFDQYDNWIEMKDAGRTFRREIKYRSKRR